MTPLDQISARLFARPGSVVYDIGALHGDHAAEYLRRGAAGVYSFEPLAANRARMPAGLTDDPRFHLLPVALSDATGTAPLHVPAANQGAGSLRRDFFDRLQRHYGSDDGEVVTVETRRLDDIDLPRARFWKIDVEGAELAVLRGAEKTLRDMPPDAIEVELFSHDHRHYLDTLNFLDRLFPHLWALGVDEGRRLVHYAVTPEILASPTFHRDLARAGTPHYYASSRDFLHWIGGRQ